jgi:hypothetical protein
MRSEAAAMSERDIAARMVPEWNPKHGVAGGKAMRHGARVPEAVSQRWDEQGSNAEYENTDEDTRRPDPLSMCHVPRVSHNHYPSNTPVL